MSDTKSDCPKCGAILTSYLPKLVCGENCKECGKYAYPADQPSYLYLLTNKELAQHKIGISTVGKDKDLLQNLISQGWLVHGIWHESDKRKTFQWEREVFKQIKSKLSAQDQQRPDLMGRWDRSWSESVSASFISVTEIEKIITKIIAGK